MTQSKLIKRAEAMQPKKKYAALWNDATRNRAGMGAAISTHLTAQCARCV